MIIGALIIVLFGGALALFAFVVHGMIAVAREDEARLLARIRRLTYETTSDPAASRKPE